MTFEYFQSQNGQFYWRARAANGRITADGAEGYTREADVKRAIQAFTRSVTHSAGCMVKVEFKK